MISYGSTGIRIGDAQRFAGDVDDIALDGAQDLLWFTSGGNLDVIDLRDATFAPVEIAKGLPGRHGFGIVGVSTVDSDGAYGATRAAHIPELVFGADSGLRSGGPKTKLVGQRWLTAQLGRKPHGWFLLTKKARGAGDAIAMMASFRDQMCKCAEKVCADKVTERMTRWGQEIAKEGADYSIPITEDDTKKMAAVTEEMTRCMTKAMTARSSH